MEWMPIETAPKDGSYILLGGLFFTPGVQIGRWGNGRYLGRSKGYQPAWVNGGFTLGGEPTHWMPLPAPPVTPSAERQPTSPASADSSR